MKTFKQIVLEVAQPLAGDEKRFKEKHKVDTIGDPQNNGDKLYKASEIKKDKTKKASYEDGEDVRVYEEVELDETSIIHQDGIYKQTKKDAALANRNIGTAMREDIEELDEISRDLATRAAHGFANKADKALAKKDYPQYKKNERARELSVKKVLGRAKINAVPRRVDIGEESIDEKTLTPAEMKKREEVAKAIERENPDMPMDKKMAIATATAKKVAEGYRVHATTKDGEKFKSGLHPTAKAAHDQHYKMVKSGNFKKIEVIKEDYDPEGEMAKTELRAIAHKALQLHSMMEDDDQLESWLQSKITKAKYMIDTVYDYILYNMPDNDEEESEDDYTSELPYPNRPVGNMYGEETDYKYPMTYAKFGSNDGKLTKHIKHTHIMFPEKPTTPERVKYVVANSPEHKKLKADGYRITHYGQHKKDETHKSIHGNEPTYEEVEQVNEISSKTLASYMSKASDARGHKELPIKKVDNRYAGVSMADKKIRKKEGYSSTAKVAAEAADLNTANVDKEVMHDCAKHVVHEQWGAGECVHGMHTIVETSEGHGFVTHYDVMFNHGIEQDVPVESLEIVSEMSHGHKKMKKEELHPNQKVLDKNKNNKIDAQDFELLRKEKKK